MRLSFLGKFAALTLMLPILFLFNNCTASFESNFNEEQITEFQAPFTIGDSTTNQKLSCNENIDYQKIFKNNVGVLTKQQYDNSIQTIFAINFSSSFKPEFFANSFRTHLQNRTASFEYTDGIFENAKRVIDSIENSNHKNKIFFCSDNQTNSCLSNFINKYGQLIWRRPLTNTEQSALIKNSQVLADQVKAADGSWGDIYKTSLYLLLTSPKFIYHQVGVSNSGLISRLNDFDMASKLSFFIWGSGPDEELLSLAASNSLTKNIDSQIDRLIASERSKYLANELSQNWLKLGFINNNPQDYQHAKYNNIQIKNALIQQVDLFLHDLIQNDRPLSDMFLSRDMFHNQITKDLYAINDAGLNSTNFNRALTSVAKLSGLGLFAHMGLNSAISSGTDYSIFHRGPWVLDNLLCFNLPGPPSGVSLDGAAQEFSSLTDALKAHADTETSCAGCHVYTDPLGAALENFDSLGRYRERYTLKNSLIKYEYNTYDGYNITSAQDLSRYIANYKKEDMQSCFSSQLLNISMMTSFQEKDGQCYAKNFATTAASNGEMTFKQLIKSIVKSDLFLSAVRGN